MSIRSEEVNYLVYRYLQESGFEHTAFSFAYESMIADTKVYDTNVPPGALITFLQKALLYTELESHVRDDATEVECVAPFSLLHPHHCVSKKKEPIDENTMEEETTNKEIHSTNVKTLEGHTQKVYSCKFCPNSTTFATASADSTVRLWNIENDTTEPPSFDVAVGPILAHQQIPNESNDVTCIDWSSDGEKLLSASYNGDVKLWSRSGAFLSDVCSLQHPVMNVAFSPDAKSVLVTGALRGFYVYSLGDNHSAQLITDTIGVNTAEKKVEGSLELSVNNIIIDSVWRTSDSFSYIDNTNHIVNINLSSKPSVKPIQVLSGHEGEINSFAWNKDKTILVSGGDDGVIKLWNDEKNSAVFNFYSHTAEINEVQTSHTDSNIFYSCSNDNNVKVYDINTGNVLYTYSNHDAPVIHVRQSYGQFSNLLCSTGMDKNVYFYDMNSHDIVRSYKANSPIYDMQFNSTGDRLCLATMDAQVYLLDLRV